MSAAERIGDENRVGTTYTTGPAESEAVNHLHGARRFEVVAAIMVLMFFSSMAQTVVSTALPNIIADLHGLSLYAWVFTAYMLGSVIVIPVYGKLSDVFGRKPMFVVSIGLFMLGSLLAGMARNMEWLVASRAIAGLGGGGMQALPQITIGDVFTPKERGKWMGVMMSAFGLASIIGPTVGGYITDNLSWRWVFWMNIPMGILPLAALLYALPSIRARRKVNIDYLGITALVVGLVPILLAITWLGEGYTWTAGRVLGAMTFGAVMLVLFILQEMRATEPIVSPAFFRSRIFLASVGASFCLGLGMFGAIMFIPLFVQGVLGNSAQDSGVILAPMMLAFMIGSTVSGQLVSRWGHYRILAAIGLAIGALGMFLYSQMDVHTGSSTVIRNMLVLGIGIGSAMPLFTIALQNAFPHKILGAVTSARQFFMSLGGVIGIPVMGAILNSRFHNEFFGHLSPSLQALMQRQGTSATNATALLSAEAQAAIKAKFLTGPHPRPDLYRQFIFAVRDGLALSIHTLFLLGFAFMSLAFVVGLFLKEIPLRQHHIEPELSASSQAADIVGAPEPLPRDDEMIPGRDYSRGGSPAAE